MHCWVLVTHGREKCMYIVRTWFFKKFQLLLRLVCMHQNIVSGEKRFVASDHMDFLSDSSPPSTPPPKKKKRKKERKDHLPWQCHVLWYRLFVPQFLQHCNGKVSYIATQWFCGDWLLQNHCWFELAWISVHHQSPVSHRKPTSDAPYSIGCKKMGFAIKYPQRRHKVLSEITVKKHHKCHV